MIRLENLLAGNGVGIDFGQSVRAHVGHSSINFIPYL